MSSVEVRVMTESDHFPVVEDEETTVVKSVTEESTVIAKDITDESHVNGITSDDEDDTKVVTIDTIIVTVDSLVKVLITDGTIVASADKVMTGAHITLG